MARRRRDLRPSTTAVADSRQIETDYRWLCRWGLATQGETDTWDLVQAKVRQLERAGLPLAERLDEMAAYIDEIGSPGVAQRFLDGLRRARERWGGPPEMGGRR